MWIREKEVFNFLRGEAGTGSTYDFIVVDPPAFVKSKAKIKEGIKGYREINSMAMRLIKKRGHTCHILLFSPH